MELQNIEIEKIASLTKILRAVKVGEDVIIPATIRNPYAVRGELSRFKRRYGIEFTATTVGVDGIKVTRIS